MTVVEITTTITAVCAGLTALGALWGKNYIETTLQKIAETEAARKLAYETEIGKITAVSETLESNTKLIESIKRDIDIGKITYQIKYSKLHERRLVVIEEVYAKVINLNIALLDYMSPFQQSKSGRMEDFESEQNEKQKKAVQSYGELNIYYRSKKLFFEESTAKTIEQLLDTVWGKLWDFTSIDRMKSFGAQPKDLTDEFKKRSEASNYIFDEIPKMLTALEKELQKTLGVDLA